MSKDGKILSKAKSILKTCIVEILKKKKKVKYSTRSKFKQPDSKNK